MENHGYEPKMSFDPIISDEGTARERLLKRKGANIADKMKDIWNFTRAKLAKSQDSQKEYANKKRTESPEY